MNEFRHQFIIECSDDLVSYAISLSEAARRQNAHSCRVYFDCIKAIGRSINATLAEIEAAEKAEKKKAEAA
jgi:hypothetical protein